MTETKVFKQWNFSVEGMHCISCIRKLQSIANNFSSLESIKVDFDHKRVTTTGSGEFDPIEFTEQVKEAGFQARVISNPETGNESLTNKVFLMRLAVAGACSGNIMLIAISGYAGADVSEFSAFLNWLSFFFFIPVLFFSSWPFYINTYNAFKLKRVSVDVPIALAIIAASVISFINLINRSNVLYFDSLSMFIFFLLASRYLIFRLQSKYLSPVNLEDVFNQPTVMKEENGETLKVMIDKLEKGDRVTLVLGQFVPADSRLMSDMAEFNNSFFSGESLPIQLKKYDNVYAGAKLISEKAVVEIEEKISNSRISDLLSKINKALLGQTPKSLLADKGAHYLSLVVVILAIGFFSYFSTIDMQESLNRVLALLVIACPCALAIATPLAHSLTVKKAFKKNILFKSAQSIEEVTQCDTIVFDKTGTLTEDSLDIVGWSPREPNNEEKQIVFSMEKTSEHPIAKALMRDIGEQISVDLINRIEVPGLGIKAEFKGKLYELRANDRSKTGGVSLIVNGKTELTALVAEKIETSIVLGELKYLRDLEKKCYLISGDRNDITKGIGQSLGFKESEILSETSPELKASFVNDLKEKGRKILFVGDGINDALAMSKADVSVSMHSAAEATFRSSSIHFLEKGVGQLRSLFHFSNRCLKAIKVNIILSLIYNLTFAMMALSGLISPVMAVIIMPLSSLTVVGLTILNVRMGEKINFREKLWKY